MRYLRFLILYASVLGGANAALADNGALIALAQGDLAKLQFAGTPADVPDVAFEDGTTPVSLEDYRGKPVLLNFWALWCAPCREEMPALNELAERMPGLQVLTVATGRNSTKRVDTYFAEDGLDKLPKLYDRKMALAQSFGVRGLPVTVLIDAEGREIGRASGALEWASPDALAFFETWVAQ